ncbi:hypothetical protein ABZX01_004606 [Vibrio vulnificus]
MAFLVFVEFCVYGALQKLLYCVPAPLNAALTVYGDIMVIKRKNALIHWNYFLALEEDLERLARFVDFSGNDKTYSLEIARLLLGASSEVDVVLKEICQKINPQTTASKINEYEAEISNALPNFTKFEVTIPKHELTFQPWVNWNSNTSPYWWRAHNKVKHNRNTHFDHATLKNCLNAVGALYVAVLHLYENEAKNGELMQLPRLFNVSDAHFGGASMGRYGNSFRYKF